MARFKLNRRTLLSGAAGAAVGLPFLEIMGEKRAQAAAPPRRYFIAFAGVSLTCDGFSKPSDIAFLTPTRAGADYDLERELTPLGKVDRKNSVRTFKAYDVQSDVSIVSGLKIPWGPPTAVPPDGHQAFHGFSMAPLLTGMRSTGPDQAAFAGPTSDQIVAETIGKGTRFPGGLQYQVQTNSYEGSYNQRGDISWRKDATGRVSKVGFTVSPQAAFKSLFTNFAPPEQSGAQSEAQKLLMEKETSILDLVRVRAERLRSQLGNADRIRLEQHFDEIRSLEQRITEMPKLATNISCQKLTAPAADPTVTMTPSGAESILGWSGEIQRAEVMRELVHMAFVCDLSRVATMLLTYAQSYMNCEYISGVKASLHGCGHGQTGADQQSDNIAWHVEQFAWLTRKLKDTVDVDGSSMLDNSVLLLVTEGGQGLDPDSGNTRANHSTEGMSVLVAGGRALGLNPGRHIPMGNKAHTAQVLLSAMKAVGVDKPLGVITSGIAGL